MKLIDEINELVKAGCTNINMCDGLTRQHLVTEFRNEQPDQVEDLFFEAIKRDGEVGSLVAGHNPNDASSMQFWITFGYLIDRTHVELIEELIDEDFTTLNSNVEEEQAALEFGE